jgi:hypothetical protein
MIRCGLSILNGEVQCLRSPFKPESVLKFKYWSRMQGNLHVRFFREPKRVTSLAYQPDFCCKMEWAQQINRKWRSYSACAPDLMIIMGKGFLRK